MSSEITDFRALLDAAPDAVVVVDEAGAIRYINRQTELIFGYVRDDLVGQQLEVLVPESVREDHKANRASYGAAPRIRSMGADLSPAGRRRDGTEFPVSITLSHLESRDGMFVIAAVRDLTLDKRAGVARSMIEASLDSLVSISPEGKITDANEATVKLTGVPRSKLIGTSFSDYFTDPRKAEAIYQRVFTEGAARDYPLTLRHRDGHEELTEVLYNASVYRDVNGQVLGVFAAARDVTKQMQAQRAIAQQQASEQERLLELERFQRLTVGRELKMIELKKEIEHLRRLGSAERLGPDDEQ